jgi:transcriptional regulator with XRE-family HTH domain
MAVHPFAVYLRKLRAARSPQDVGIVVAGVRRVPGLRRDELARLAGVSTDYYTRLEQGRVGRPSDSVLDALSRALQLEPAERIHLTDLANSSRKTQPAAPTAPVRPELAHLVAAITSCPAVIVNSRTDVLSWNPLAAAIIADFPALPIAQRNMAVLLFLHPHAADRHPDWDRAARDTVGILRMAAGRDDFDPRLRKLVDDLAIRSEPFRALWATHHVHEKTHGTKLFRHPDTGVIELNYETLHIPGPENLMLVTYAAEPDSSSAVALAMLGSLIATAEPVPSPEGSDEQ